jgi:phosphatidylglycerophosphate synthase
MTSDGTILLRATRGEAIGAGLRIAGLSVLERNLKQLAALKAAVVVASDGSCPLPATLPPMVEVRDARTAAALDDLRTQIRPTREIGADEVRPSRDFDNSVKVIDEDSRKRAEDAVFAQLLRGDLGVVARHLNKPISFRITRYLLCHLPLSPNQVSVLAALIGLLGAGLVAMGNRWLMIAGFLLVHVQSVLDGCDGELARVRFQQSKLGEWLDTFLDEMLNIALFACTGIGLWRQTGSTLALTVGLGAAAMYVFYDVVALTELARQGRGGEILHIRWWLAGNVDMKARTGKNKRDLLVMIHALGRRDLFVFAFVLYAVAGVPFLALIHGSLIAGPQFILACAQVGWRLAQPSRR